MAFNDAGPRTLLIQGGETWWWYTRNGGSDFGAQYASADVKTPNSGAVHLADMQRKTMENNGKVTYRVRITNQGPGSAWHNLQGGGFV
jgi:hypothetical protein